MRDKQEQLEWEARAGRLAGFAALGAAGLIVATFAWRIAALPRGANNVKELLPQIHAHEGAFLVSGILTALAMLAFIPPLLYLYGVTRYRRPELPTVARVLIFLGPILFAICSVWVQFRQQHAADQFLAGANKTNKHAEHVLSSSTAVVAALSLAASIATGLATILVSLNAMRAGLLSRFMGILGVILGALFVLPLVASPIIQLFWLLALGALFIGLWPGAGRGPAWESGEAEPWPSPPSRFAPPPAQEQPDPEPDTEAVSSPGPNGSRKRRKKKARR